MTYPPDPPLSPRMLVWAYMHGLFPMAEHRSGPVGWYSPDPRAILPLDALHVSHSLRKRLRRQEYTVTHDRAFAEVIAACAAPRPYAPDTWINDQIVAACRALFDAGLAHSVEAWASGASGAPPQLVGGLYGVALGGAFFGESMFSRATDASKVCLVRLVEHLQRRGFALLDVQFANPHMAQFGVVEIAREEYRRRLAEALALAVTW